jgi:RimJ/RimL family protein N-acetyltransferase
MEPQPHLLTRRLLLRPFTLCDAPAVRRLCNDARIAANTLHIPHPYEEGMAEAWIGTHTETFAQGAAATFAVVRRADEALIGAIGLAIAREHARAEMGYWIGALYWGKGYCTEAAGALLAYAFVQRGLNRVHACHFSRNLASGRVMQKVGMKLEGVLRQHVKKGESYVDLVCYGILKGEWEALREGRRAKFEAALAQVPDVEPDEQDRL